MGGTHGRIYEKAKSRGNKTRPSVNGQVGHEARKRGEVHRICLRDHKVCQGRHLIVGR